MKKTKIPGVVILIICSSLILSSCKNSDSAGISSDAQVDNLKLYNEKGQAVDLNLYFDASQDEKNPQIGKEERLIQKQELIGELIVNELIKGPSLQSSYKPILPKTTKLLSFSINNSIAYVNFSSEAEVAMTPVKEAATLESLTTSLTQLSYIKKVKIQVSNKDVETLGGNYDISKPLSKGDILQKIKK